MRNRYFIWDSKVLVIESAGFLADYVRRFTEVFGSDINVKGLELSQTSLVCIRRAELDPDDFPYYNDDEFRECPDPSITDSWVYNMTENLDEGKAIISRDGVQWVYTDHGGHHYYDTGLTPIMPLSWLDAIAQNQPLPQENS